jgi:hypothetical protein
VRPGDELIRFDGFEANPLTRVFERGNDLRPGKEVQVWFRRGVQTIRVSLIVPKAPGAEPTEKDQKAEKSDKKDKDANSDEQPEEGKKKKKRKSPVVIKPIPAPSIN